ncbi:MAG: peptide-methionine (S)-S-oxide reductase MsrA [Oleiphilaceae bacterium]|nr:peptide-methionine (S)-S-oxide reductase MsrA [Oleiphilaceae bacterium]
MSYFTRKNIEMPAPDKALPGRPQAVEIGNRHYVLNTPLKPPFPEHLDSVVVGMGCFWGAEKQFWSLDGVYTTAVGYGQGYTPNPTYEEVCSGMTGHNEVVLVVYDPQKIAFRDVLVRFWENHDPTQGMRQGNDLGTQYRSGIYCQNSVQLAQAEGMKAHYEEALKAAGYHSITTEITLLSSFYYAEDYHQQYLAKNPNGYCGLGGTGVHCRVRE